MKLRIILFLILCFVLLISFFILLISAVPRITLMTSSNTVKTIPTVVIDAA